jgi:hypothetical protein
MVDWLKGLGLQPYTRCFAESDIDISTNSPKLSSSSSGSYPIAASQARYVFERGDWRAAAAL